MTGYRLELTFEGDLPEDEMDRSAITGDPAVRAARDELIKAFKDAGATVTARSTVHKVRPPSTKPRQPRSVPRAAAE
jgi:hypothetical protein